jgi:hypothetical protein
MLNARCLAKKGRAMSTAFPVRWNFPARALANRTG